MRPEPRSDSAEWTAPTLEILPDGDSRSDWALTLPRPVPPGPAKPLPLPRMALPSRIPPPPIAPLPPVAPPRRRPVALPPIAPLPRPAPLPRIAPPPAARPPPAPPPHASTPRRISTPAPPRASAAPLPPLPTFTQQAEPHFPPRSQQLVVEPAVVVHRTQPPPAAQDFSRSHPTSPPTGVAHPSSLPAGYMQGSLQPSAVPAQEPMPAPVPVVQGSVPPPAGAIHTSGAPPSPFVTSPPPPKRPRLSNVALTFIAFYLAAAAVLVIVLVARHGTSAPPTVTASDTQKTPISIASVFVDGHEVCGALPCQLPQRAGQHWVSIRAQGYAAPDPVHTDGKTPIHFTLRRLASTAPSASAPAAPAPSASTVAELPKASSTPAAAPRPRRTYWHAPARLSFYSRPSSMVLLDGHPLGKTPRFGVKVSPGRHSVLFVHGSRRVVRAAWAIGGRTRSVSAHF